VSAQEEIERLDPLVAALKQDGVKISIDSFVVETQRWALSRNVDFLNDIRGFPRAEFYPELAKSSAKLIVMHALRHDGLPRRDNETPPNLFERIVEFFHSRIAALTKAGVDQSRLILDPGMGLFLGNSRDASFQVLRRVADLKISFGLPVLISVSRKSFLRPKERAASEAGAATLAAELYAVAEGADYIRTHDPQALRDGLFVMRNLPAQNVKDIPDAPLL
jgi:dihydropteroate synthase type 2